MRSEAVACIVVLGLVLVALVGLAPRASAAVVATAAAAAAAAVAAVAAVAAAAAAGPPRLIGGAPQYSMDRADAAAPVTGGSRLGLFARVRALRGKASAEIKRRLRWFVKRASPGFELEASRLALGGGAGDAAVLASLREAWLARDSGAPSRAPDDAAARLERARARVDGIPVFPELGAVLGALRAGVGALEAEFRYLDVGSSEGSITAAFAADLRLGPDRAFACDPVAQAKESPDYTFRQSDGNSIPYADADFDFITMFMSAHHFEDPGRMFAEAFRVARPGAHLLLREHGRGDATAGLYYDLVHAFYEVVLTPPAAPEATPGSFALRYARGPIATYRAPDEWVRIAVAAGFAFVQASEVLADRFDSVYILFRRPA